ncbi:CRISPR-associated protein Cas5, Hmari subtype, partial [Candidatus Magnetomorum sp. HK-1]
SFENISYVEISQHVDTICIKDFAQPDPNLNLDRHFVVDRMPIHFEKESANKKGKQTISGRVLHSIKNVIHEKSGLRIFGTFKNCYHIDNLSIAFFEE